MSGLPFVAHEFTSEQRFVEQLESISNHKHQTSVYLRANIKVTWNLQFLTVLNITF